MEAGSYEAYRGKQWVEGLESPTLEQRLKVFQGLAEQRSGIIEQLCDLLERWGDNRTSDVVEIGSPEHLALLALGSLRASEAPQTIVEYLRVRDSAFNPRVSDESVGLDNYFPALRSLILIGKPSVPYLREAIAMSQDNLTIQLAVVGMIRIEEREYCRLRLTTLREEINSGMINGRAGNIDKGMSYTEDPTVGHKLKPPSTTLGQY